MLKKVQIGFILVCFVFNLGLPSLSFAQDHPNPFLNLPSPGTMLSTSPAFTPVIVRGLQIDPKNPLQFNFIVDTGDASAQGDAVRTESARMIKYFLAALTVPDKELWVNLSPYEKDRIIANGLGQTEMGRDMLAQDYILKQLTASLIYPEGSLGKVFWAKVYQRVQEKYGSTQVPVNTFNKVWIVPSHATIYEHDGTAFITENKLKVMLEEDYLSLQKHIGGTEVRESASQSLHAIGSQIIREIVLPELEKEVNEGKNFAQLRQIANAVVLATWYKQNLKASLLGQVYADKNKVIGVDVQDKNVKIKIYEQYLKAFKQGVYNYIKEDVDPLTNQTVPRKYFSGGENLIYGPENLAMSSELDPGKLDGINQAQIVTWKALPETGALAAASAAMVAITPQDINESIADQKAWSNKRIQEAVAKEQPILDIVREFAGIPEGGNLRVMRTLEVSNRDLPLIPVKHVEEGQEVYMYPPLDNQVVEVSYKTDGVILATPALNPGEVAEDLSVVFSHRAGAPIDGNDLIGHISASLLKTKIVEGPMPSSSQFPHYEGKDMVIENMRVVNTPDGKATVTFRLWYKGDGKIQRKAQKFELAEMNQPSRETSKNPDVPTIDEEASANVAIDGPGRIGLPAIWELMLGKNSQTVMPKLVIGNSAEELVDKLYKDDGATGFVIKPQRKESARKGKKTDEIGEYVEVHLEKDGQFVDHKIYTLDKLADNATPQQRAAWLRKKANLFEDLDIRYVVESHQAITKEEAREKDLKLGAEMVVIAQVGKKGPSGEPTITVLGTVKSDLMDKVTDEGVCSAGSCTTGALSLLSYMVDAGGFEAYTERQEMKTEVARQIAGANPAEERPYVPGSANFEALHGPTLGSDSLLNKTGGFSVIEALVGATSGAHKALQKSVPVFKNGVVVHSSRNAGDLGESFVNGQIVIKTKKGEVLTAEGFNERIRQGVEKSAKGVYAVENLYSLSQIKGRTESGILVANATQVQALDAQNNTYLVNVTIAYNNEKGFAARVADEVQIIAGIKATRFAMARTVDEMVTNRRLDGVVSFDEKGAQVLDKTRLREKSGAIEYLLAQANENPDKGLRQTARRFLTEIRQASGVSSLSLSDIEATKSQSLGDGEQFEVPSFFVQNDKGLPDLYYGMRQYVLAAKNSHAGLLVFDFEGLDEETLRHRPEFKDGYAATLVALAEAAVIEEGYTGNVYFNMGIKVAPLEFEYLRDAYLQHRIQDNLLTEYHDRVKGQEEYLQAPADPKKFDEFVQRFAPLLRGLGERAWYWSEAELRKAVIDRAKDQMRRAYEAGVSNFYIQLAYLERNHVSDAGRLEIAEELFQFVRTELEAGHEDRLSAYFGSDEFQRMIARNYNGILNADDLLLLESGKMIFDQFKERYPQIIRALGAAHADSPIHVIFEAGDLGDTKELNEALEFTANARHWAKPSTRIRILTAEPNPGSSKQILEEIVRRADAGDKKAQLLKTWMMQFIAGLLFSEYAPSDIVKNLLAESRLKGSLMPGAKFEAERKSYPQILREILKGVVDGNGKIKADKMDVAYTLASQILLDNVPGHQRALNGVLKLLPVYFGQQIFELLGYDGPGALQGRYTNSSINMVLRHLDGEQDSYENIARKRYESLRGKAAALPSESLQQDAYFHNTGKTTAVPAEPGSLRPFELTRAIRNINAKAASARALRARAARTVKAKPIGADEAVRRVHLQQLALQVAPPGKFVFAMDDTLNTLKSAFDKVRLDPTPQNIRRWRRLALSARGLRGKAGSIILHVDTLNYTTNDESTELLINELKKWGINIVVKTDEGQNKFKSGGKETGEQELAPWQDRLDAKLTAAIEAGAVATKFRSVTAFPVDGNGPSEWLIQETADQQIEQTIRTQRRGLAVMYEPEILRTGTHGIEAAFDAEVRTLNAYFDQAEEKGVILEGVVVKTSIVAPGENSSEQKTVTPEMVADRTIEALIMTIPKEVSGVVFLSGGIPGLKPIEYLNAVEMALQTRFETIRDEAVRKLEAQGRFERAAEIGTWTKLPWHNGISSSYGRTLQGPMLKALVDNGINTEAGAAALERAAEENATINQHARLGVYESRSAAMMADAAQRVQHPEREGGINLDPAMYSIQIKRDGSGFPLPVNQQPVAMFNVRGFRGIIESIRPANLPLMLGLTETSQKLALNR